MSLCGAGRPSVCQCWLLLGAKSRCQICLRAQPLSSHLLSCDQRHGSYKEACHQVERRQVKRWTLKHWWKWKKDTLMPPKHMWSLKAFRLFSSSHPHLCTLFIFMCFLVIYCVFHHIITNNDIIINLFIEAKELIENKICTSRDNMTWRIFCSTNTHRVQCWQSQVCISDWCPLELCNMAQTTYKIRPTITTKLKVPAYLQQAKKNSQ